MKKIYTAFILMLFFTLVTGILYPLILWGLGNIFFNHRASGSFLENKKTHEIIGSSLIGQNFQAKKYFHGRPSVCDYNAMLSGATNLAPTSKTLYQQVEGRLEKYKKENDLPDSFSRIPPDAVFSSGSGLDPHISVENAYLQANRIASERGVALEEIMRLIDQHTEKPLFGIFGKKLVSVLLLNAKLDGITLEKK